MIMNVPSREEVKEIKKDLGGFKFEPNPDDPTKGRYSLDGGVNWVNFSSGAEAKLIWTNSAPTSQMGNVDICTIPNYSEYDYIAIISQRDYYHTALEKNTVTLIKAKNNMTAFISFPLDEASGGFSYRGVKLVNGTLKSILNAGQWSPIPYYVLGVKGVKCFDEYLG